MRHSWLLSVMMVLVGEGAWAQVKPPVAAYPLDVLVRGINDQQVKELQAEFRRLLGLEAAMPDGLALDAALAMTERKDCDLEDACLKQFAVNAKVLYAVYASVESDAKQKQIIAKGRVVRDDGVLVIAAKSVTVQRKSKDAVDVAVREALKALYAELKIAALVPTRDVVKKDPDPVVKKDPDPIKKDPDVPPPPPPPVVDTGAGQRAAGTAMLIGGVGVAAVGAVLSSVGCGIGCAVPRNSDGAVIDRNDIPKLQTGATLMGAGFAAVGVGVGVAAIGSIVLASAPAPVKSVSVVPMPGGAVVQFGGSF